MPKKKSVSRKKPIKRKSKPYIDSRVRLGFASYIATHLQQQINFADTKAAWTFSVLAVSAGALVTKITRIDWTSVNVVQTTAFFSLAAAMIIIAFLQIVRVIYPRLIKGNKEGISYFGDIIENTEKNYVSRGLDLKEDEAIKELYGESYTLARIASEKFRHLHYGIILTSIALITTMIVLLVT